MRLQSHSVRLHPFAANEKQCASRYPLTDQSKCLGGITTFDKHPFRHGCGIRRYCDCRKLMGHRPTLQDLKDVHPDIYHSLQKLLAQDNAAQLGLVFQVISSQRYATHTRLELH